MLRRRIVAAVATAALSIPVLLGGCGKLGDLAGGGSKPAASASAAPKGAKPSQVIQPKIVFKTNTKIKPTAIVLHWWAHDGGSDIQSLINDLNKETTTYDPKKTHDDGKVVDHLSVQIGVTQGVKANKAKGVKAKPATAYQLTSYTNSFARHAKCANYWAIGIEIEGSEPGSGMYIGDRPEQFKTVVAAVKQLMYQYQIPLTSSVAPDGKSGQGILSHKQVDETCQWKGGKPAGSGKIDVDDKYLQRVRQAVGAK